MKGYFDNVTPPSVFLKRATTTSTKESNLSYDSSTAYSSYFSFPNSQNEASTLMSPDEDSSMSSQQSADSLEDDYASLFSTRMVDDETLPSLPSVFQKKEAKKERIDYTDNILDTNTKNRALSLAWDRGKKVASSFRIGLNKNSIVDDVCELPDGISKSDITVTIDIDDEARSSLAAELDEEDLDVEILHHTPRYDSGDFSPRKLAQRRRQEFEESVRQGILDDLSSVYTANPKDAKYVLCVLISVLSDGTLDHTFWSGGRVGLTEIIMQWIMFDSDDLQVYKRGRVVQKKDFGFGPLGLTENEGQHYLATTLAPRATNEIISKIGSGVDKELLAEF
eukprot:CAMPEP_0116137600 /NCGR_PEP_ID=MMETSP0329-20121206/12330_1 /TAXON_ID=697910 /ORGANISM="Pseudo-nitzschia arenysensis, Strain B593" /LENGTH=336 /DNA_ID=CAMNT_0003632517 /DNA_START=27 /DNA_END=1040 /DNA_ORIENTATION=+